MREIYLAIAGLISTAVAYVTGKMGVLVPLFGILVAMMTLDYVTGMLASKKEAIDRPTDPDAGWSSRKGAVGIFKKLAILAAVIVAMSLDYVVKIMTDGLGFDPPAMPFIALLVIVWFLLNEMLSIIENAGRMGGNVPVWLAKYIAVLKNRIDDQGGSGHIND